MNTVTRHDDAWNISAKFTKELFPARAAVQWLCAEDK